VTFFIDSDICIAYLRNGSPSVTEQFRSVRSDQVKIPSMVAAELVFGACKSSSPLTAQKVVNSFLEAFEIVPFDQDAVEVYARIRLELEQKGTMIGPNDLIIAATVLSRHGTLITHNAKEFSRVSGLLLQDWTI
jgi:tRNA(fMet)-specific endonuclease VapC